MSEEKAEMLLEKEYDISCSEGVYAERVHFFFRL